MGFLPRTGATELANNQASPEPTVNELGRHLDAAATRYIIEDRDLTAPPATCADGACYLVKATATGLWAGKDGLLAKAVGTNAASGWLHSTVATEGVELYVKDEDIELRHDGSTWQALTANSVRPISFFFTTTPTASEKLMIFVACQSITLADEFAGSTCSVGTNPTSSFVLDVKKNSSPVGTITISTGGAATFVTTGTTVTLASGDRLSITAPATPDATIADVAITLKGAI